MVEGRKLTEGTFAAVTADERVQDAYLGRRR
jgi:ABC-type branched-subunit amino acid transport system ATPase component